MRGLTEFLIPVTVLIVALVGKAKSVAIAACIILIVQLLGPGGNFLQNAAPTLGTIGLALVLVQTLSPLVTGETTLRSIASSVFTPLGITAFVLSMATTYLSGRGITYMNQPANAGMFIPLLLGGVVSAALFKGLPVGPYITAGILSVVGGLLVKMMK